MTHKILTSFFVLALAVTTSSAKVTTLSGVESSYAGKQLKLNTKLDEIVGLEHTLAECSVDEKGFFSFVVDIDAPIQAFIPTEGFNGYIFLEPGVNYQVNIPIYTERTLAQKLDPYYKPTDILLEIIGMKQDDFNYKLMQFEDAFDFYSMKHVMYGSQVDSILVSIQQMRDIFPDFNQDSFLNSYMENRFLLLLNSSQQVYQDSIISRLNHLGAQPSNPAFWDIFNNVFDDFIPQTAYDRQQYLAFQRVIEEGNVKMYFMLITKRYGITDRSLRELVAIKWLSDLLNQNQFDQFKVLDLLQKIGAGISDDRNRAILTEILNSASSIIIGEKIPDFEIISLEGKKKKISDFIGEYIYLNFENSSIDQTQKDLDVLTRFQSDYKNNLTIVNVGLYDTKELVGRLAQRYPKMSFFYSEDSDSLRKLYHLSSIPHFFLIDKDGKFLMTKGAEPSDELRMLLQHIFKSN